MSVSIEGKPSMIGNLDEDNVKLTVYADMSNIFMTPVTLPLRAEITSGDALRIVRIEPQNITVNSLEGR